MRLLAWCAVLLGAVLAADACTDASGCNGGTCEGDPKACKCAAGKVGTTCEFDECPADVKTTCTATNTDYCKKLTETTGECVCKANFFGPKCADAECVAAVKTELACSANAQYCKKLTETTGECVCKTGFNGAKCDDEVCTAEQATETKCVENKFEYCKKPASGTVGTCVCKDNFFGPKCDDEGCTAAQVTATACTTNAAYCKKPASGDVGTCVCKTGFFGPTCADVACSATETSAAACQNGAPCRKSPDGTTKCDCSSTDPKKGGPKCADDLCAADSAACDKENILECYKKDVAGTKTDTCVCKPHITGTKCDAKSKCLTEADFCKNGGTCVTAADGTASCDCSTTTPKKGGPKCEDDSCANPNTECTAAGNYEQCYMKPGATAEAAKVTTCVCKPHVSGDKCQTKSECFTTANYCKNNGKCVTAADGTTVSCDCAGTGKGGPTCNDDLCAADSAACTKENILECYKKDVGGTKVDTCVCKPHITGRMCETKTSKCLDTTAYCQNNGVCHTAPDGTATCDCSAVAKKGPVCNDDPCGDAAAVTAACPNEAGLLNCYKKATVDTCLCKLHYTGAKCETPSNCLDATKNPCKNGGYCQTNAETGAVTCDCATSSPAKTGPTCEVDECTKAQAEAAKCEEEGTDHCKNAGATGECVCKMHYTDANCKTKSTCLTTDKDKCKNDGVCVTSKTGVVSCDCSKSAKVGPTCELVKCPEGATCTEAGTAYCHVKDNKNVCVCKPGYWDANCDKQSICLTANPCQNNAKCVTNAADGTTTCDCTGLTPEKVGDKCHLDKCTAGAMTDTAGCDKTGSDYCWKDGETGKCACKPHYTGAKCETPSKCTKTGDEAYCKNKGVCSTAADGKESCDCSKSDPKKGGPVCNSDLCANDSPTCKKTDSNTKECYKATATEEKCICNAGWEGADCGTKSCTVKDKCKNGGTCAHVNNKDTCTCKGHWRGNTCETATECQLTGAEIHCKNSGTCNTKQPEGTVSCTCKDTHVGPICDKTPCTAAQKPKCKEIGTKTDYCEKLSDTEHKCHCKDGYFGDDCDFKSECYKTGDDAHCKFGGTCKYSAEAKKDTCECINGYHGDTCDKAADVCAKDECKNGGTCKRVDKVDTCTCINNFRGDLCELGPCKGENPCKNFGECYTEGGAPDANKCKCKDGFKGDFCDADVDECVETPKICKFDGTCTNKPNGFSCACKDGYSGLTCELGNPCKVNANYCNGKGTCKEVGMKAECINCQKGYYGPTCDKGPCTKNPCGSHGECAEQAADPFYKCTCKSGWSGAKCDTDIDECNPADKSKAHPCKNGATCSNSPPGEYSCACQTGWTGKNCDEDVDECSTTVELLKHKCDAQAKCKNMGKKADNMGYECECNAGLIGNGLVGRCQANVLLTLDNPTSFAEADAFKDVTLDFGIPIGEGKQDAESRDTSLRQNFRIDRNGFIATDWSADTPLFQTADSAKNFKVCAAYMTKLVKGTVKYALYTKTNNNAAKLTERWDAVKTKLVTKHQSMVPEVLLIAEWKGVQPDAAKTKLTTEFQIFVISDAKQTVCAVQHQPGGNKWTKNTNSPPIFMGFSDGNGLTVTSLTGSLGVDASNIDVVKGTNDQVGFHAFEWGKIYGTKNYEYDCWKWTEDNKAKKVDQYKICPFMYEQIMKQKSLYEYQSSSESFVRREATTDKKVKYICQYLVKDTNGKKNGALITNYPTMNVVPEVEGLTSADVLNAREACCAMSGMCTRFIEVVPAPTSADFKASTFEASIGDPHISTLDGKTYTFNGKGEYILLQTKTGSTKDKVVVQCGTDKPTATSPATVFSKFVFMAKDSSMAQVELSADKKSMKIYSKGTAAGATWTEETFSSLPAAGKKLEKMILAKSGDKEVTVGYFNGWEFKVGLGVDMLSIAVMAPVSYKATPPAFEMEGLMGNFDGNADNDFKDADGNAITGTTEEDRYNGLKSWAVKNDATNLFHYTGSAAFTGHDDSFKPKFLDQYNTAENWRAFFTEQDATNGADLYTSADGICKTGGKTEADRSYKLCMFDVASTGNLEIGKSTAETEEAASSAKAMMANIPPKIELTDGTEIVFKINQEKTVNIKLSDPDATQKVTLGFSGATPSGATLVDNADRAHNDVNPAKLKWTPTNTTPYKFELLAKDSVGGEVLQLLQVRLDHCENEGTPTWTHLTGDNAVTNPNNFYLAKCTCKNDFSGDSCQIKPCDRVPSFCYKGVQCSYDEATKKAKCGDCPEGTEGDDGRVCTDIDECATENGKCEFNCVNSVGSYACTCNTGMKPDENDNKKCVDVDECATGDHNCKADQSKKCENMAGSYRCVCMDGFKLNEQGNCADIDECALNTDDCDKHAECQNMEGGFKCTCKAGFSGDGKICADIDECLNPNLNSCEQTCQNVADGTAQFNCGCNEGYELQADKKKCLVNPNNKCDDGHGCVGTCAKINGNPVCSCPKKKKLGADKKSCLDLDLQTDLCPPLGCKGECVDDGNGGPKCSCKAGLKLAADQISCVDVDECTEKKADGKTPIHDCAAPPAATCTNKPNGELYECKCADGYTGDGKTCKDINECDDHPCHKFATCINQPGVPTDKSESCICMDTYFGNGLVCDKAWYSFNAGIRYLDETYIPAYRNINSTESQTFARKIRTMIEKALTQKYGTGYKGLRISSLKDGSVTANVNTQFGGGATVDSAGVSQALGDGMTETDGICYFGSLKVDCTATVSDFDECAAGQDVHNCPSSTKCANEPEGTYSCKCKPEGYKKVGQVQKGSVVVEQCEDIDECPVKCLKPRTNCTNLPGSFKCMCEVAGEWSLDPTTTECTSVCDPSPCQNGECSWDGNSGTGYKCACPEHYTGVKCEIVDPQYAEMRTTAIVIGVVFGLLILLLLVLLFCVWKKRRRSDSAAWHVQGDKYRRKGSQPVHKTVGPDGRPVLLDDYESGSIPRAKRDPERQHYEMSENSPRRSAGQDNPAFQAEFRGGKQGPNGESPYF